MKFSEITSVVPEKALREATYIIKNEKVVYAPGANIPFLSAIIDCGNATVDSVIPHAGGGLDLYLVDKAEKTSAKNTTAKKEPNQEAKKTAAPTHGPKMTVKATVNGKEVPLTEDEIAKTLWEMLNLDN